MAFLAVGFSPPGTKPRPERLLHPFTRSPLHPLTLAPSAEQAHLPTGVVGAAKGGGGERRKVARKAVLAAHGAEHGLVLVGEHALAAHAGAPLAIVQLATAH